MLENQKHAVYSYLQDVDLRQNKNVSMLNPLSESNSLWTTHNILLKASNKTNTIASFCTASYLYFNKNFFEAKQEK